MHPVRGQQRRRFWHEARALKGTPGESYLRRPRGIEARRWPSSILWNQRRAKGLPVTPDNFGASPRLEDERPQNGDGAHGATLGKAAGAKPPRGWKPPPKLTAARYEGGRFKPCNPFDAQLADAEL